MKFAWIKDHQKEFAVEVMCQSLQVSTSGFYAWQDRAPSARTKRQQELACQIRQVHAQVKGVYGSPRIHQTLKAQGHNVCKNTIARIMKRQQIRAKTKKKFVPRTTDSAHGYLPARNLLKRCFESPRPNRKWVTDITYVPTDQGWLHTAVVMDLCSRRIVGWSMADHMKVELVSDALKMALVQRDPPAGLVHHSDRGVQYCCKEYQDLLKKHRLSCSMSARGNCYDNAAMESFWASLKTERVYQEHYETREQARQSIFEYIEVFYNRKRLHSSLGYLSPEQFEASLN
jgi:putative transposase